MFIPIIILTAGIISLGLTDQIRKFALKRNLIDIPNNRSSHTLPTPRIGGVAILLTWFPGITAFYLTGSIEKELFLALLCGLPIALISIFDDIKNINPLIRLFVHFSSSFLAFYYLDFLRPFFTFDIQLNYPLIVIPFVLLGMVWFINLFNFMDGIDGFASVEAIYISFILFFFQVI